MSLNHQRALAFSPLQRRCLPGYRPQRQEINQHSMSVHLRDYPLCPCIDHSSPMPMNNLSRTVAEQRHVVSRSLGKLTALPPNEKPPPLFLFVSHIPPSGTPPSRPRPLAPVRLKRSKSLKPSSHHEPPTASHTGKRGDATAPQLEPSAPPSSSLPLLASNLRERQAMG
jgi:hypothetical protein